MAQTKNPSNPSVFNENGLATDETLLRFLQTLQGQLPANGIIPAFSLDSNGNPNGFVGLTTLNANVIPRTNTLAQLELLVSTDNEIAVATDNAVLAVYRTGTSTPDLYYANKGFAHKKAIEKLRKGVSTHGIGAGRVSVTVSNFACG